MADPAQVFALSKLFHERARLAIMTALVTSPSGVDFTQLLQTLKLTKGNLALHVRKLEEAGYVSVEKEFVGRVPRTTYSATATGRRDFGAYLSLLEDIISGAKEGG